MTARRFYVALIRLHPRGFRDAFADDMLCLFDDAADTYGTQWLLRDAALSLMRQRLLRSQESVEDASAPGQFCLLAGIYPDIRAPHLTPAKLSGALVLTLLSLFVFPPHSAFVRHGKPERVEVRYGTFESRW